jgi:hypothetical protein
LQKKENVSDITRKQYDQAVESCRSIFQKKTIDYGTAWRILRPTSLTDQIFIKASRIRSIEEKGINKVGDRISDEFIGIYNYSLLALIQLSLDPDVPMELEEGWVMTEYDKKSFQTRDLMLDKNHDYGEAWRSMRISTFTDLILMKIKRIRQIEDNDGKTIISEGLDANYSDMMNYAIFALIRLGEKNS